MSKNELESWYRAGAAYGAADVVPMTARTWKRTVKLEFGEQEGGGHPKYNLIDVLCLRIMRSLTQQMQMSASFAAAIVNGLRQPLLCILPELVEEQDGIKGQKRDTFPFAIATVDRSRSNLPKVQLIWNVGELADVISSRQSPECCAIIPIVVLLNEVRTILTALPDHQYLEHAPEDQDAGQSAELRL